MCTAATAPAGTIHKCVAKAGLLAKTDGPGVVWFASKKQVQPASCAQAVFRLKIKQSGTRQGGE
eukprot:1248876-Lingulodinium_polyedra.AAC.1